MTVTRSTRRGRASATAALKRRTVCDPPKISRTRSPGSISRRRLAASRSRSRTSRIGVPVTKHGRSEPTAAPRARQVASNETAITRASRAVARTARPRNDVAIPEHDRDAERRGGQQDRHGDVATGREDGGRALAREHGRRLGDGQAEPDRIEHGVDVGLGRPQRSRRQPGQRDAGRRDEARLQPAMAAEPVQRRPVRTGAKRPCDGERRVDVSARPAGRDQQSHPRSMSPSPPFRARSTAGSRPPRS